MDNTLNRSLVSSEDAVIIERGRLIDDALKRQYGKYDSYPYLKDLIVYRYCKSCKQPKPPRAHHCQACGKCIMRMDHHCPWVGGCVGFKNHKLFLLFLIYTTGGCLYSALTMGLCTMNVLNDASFTVVPDPTTHTDIQLVPHGSGEKQRMLLASVLSAALILAIAVLLFTHLYFVFANQCSVEAGTLQTFNPFFISWSRHNEQKPACCLLKLLSRDNFKQAAGVNPWYWLIPVRAPAEYQTCDGYNWELKKVVKTGQ